MRDQRSGGKFLQLSLAKGRIVRTCFVTRFWSASFSDWLIHLIFPRPSMYTVEFYKKPVALASSLTVVARSAGAPTIHADGGLNPNGNRGP